MTKNVFAWVFCCIRTTLIALRITWPVIFFVQLYDVINITTTHITICTCDVIDLTAQMSCDYKLQITNYKLQLECMSFWFWSYLSQVLAEFLKSWTDLWGITICICPYNIYKVLVIIVEIQMGYFLWKSLGQKTGPNQSFFGPDAVPQCLGRS